MRTDQVLHLLDHASAARFGPVAVDQHRERVHRLGIDQDRHLHQIADPVAFDLIIERGIALRDALQPVIEVKHHLIERQVIDDQGPGSDIAQFALLPAPVLAKLDHRTQIFVRCQDGGLDPGLCNGGDLHRVGHVGRIVQLDFCAVGQANFVNHARRGGDQVQIEFAAQSLLNDLQMQQT